MANLDNLIQLAEEKSKYVIEVMREQHDFIALVDSGDKMTVVSFNLPEEDKHSFAPAFAHLLRELKAVRYILISEAWATTSKRPSTEGIRVSELPLDDRDEILQITAVENKGIMKSKMAIIDNTPRGRKLREFRAMQVLSGRMVVKEW